jgi:hypothetical protein
MSGIAVLVAQPPGDICFGQMFGGDGNFNFENKGAIGNG